MNEDFITNGIEDDRYLKAVRLYKQFEEELFRTLENVSQDVIEAKPQWFPDEIEQDRNLTRRRTEPLGHIRLDTEMNRTNSSGEALTFHVCIEWTQPGIHRHEDHTDGNLCIVFYKIKDLDRSVYDDIRDRTQQSSQWNEIHFDNDLWNSNLGLFYIPVESGPAIKDAFEVLKDHFYEFGDEYGEPLDGN